MASIAVVGAGFAGMSAAARLAKLGHDVTVYDAAEQAGGRLNGVNIDGKIWQPSPMAVTLPGVFRDLFRKSGRAMSATLGMETAEPRKHIFSGSRGNTELEMPTGTRSAQHDAIKEAFGRDPWSPWLDSLVDEWDVTRRFIYEQVTSAEDIRALEDRISVRQTATQAARKALKHKHIASLAIDCWRLSGLDPRITPAAWHVWHYVERNFGRWRFDGDMDGLAAALIKRLGERKVTLTLGTPVRGVTMKLGRVTGIQLDEHVVEADHIIWASGHSLPGLSYPNFPLMGTVYSGVELAEGAALPKSLMVHGKYCMSAWDSGPNRWVTSTFKGTDVARVLKRVGIPKDAILSITEFEPPQRQVHEAQTIGSGLNLDLKKNRGPRNEMTKFIARPAVSPAPGLFLVGGAAISSSSLELTGMGTAAVAQAIGAAPRQISAANDAQTPDASTEADD